MSLAQKILKVVESSSIPVATPDIVAIVATGMTNSRARVWAVLIEMRDGGLVKECGRVVQNRRWVQRWTAC